MFQSCFYTGNTRTDHLTLFVPKRALTQCNFLEVGNHAFFLNALLGNGDLSGQRTPLWLERGQILIWRSKSMTGTP